MIKAIMQNTSIKPSYIIALLCSITTIGRFVMDNYLPSLPAISQAFNAPVSDVQLTITLYIFGFGLSQLIYGPLSDRYGRKIILIGGLILFLIANTLCAFTKSLDTLLVARLLSGIGMGVCGVLNRAIACDCFSGAAFSKAWSYTTTTLVVVLIFAPIIGSGVQELFGWQANFNIATLFVSIVLFIILWKLPETNQTQLSSISMKSIFTNYKNLLLSRSFVLSTLCYTFAFSGLIAYFQVSPFLLMNELHLTPLQYGFSSLAIASGYLVGGFIVRKLARVLGIKLLLLTGIVLVITSGICMISLNYEEEVTLISVLLPTTLYVIGARIIIPNAMAGAFTGFHHLGGTASGLIGGIQMLGTALISLLMINFSYKSPLPLAFLFTGIGLLSLGAFCFMYFYKNKFVYKHFIQLNVTAIQFYRTQQIRERITHYVNLIDKWLTKKYNADYKQRLQRMYNPLLKLAKIIYLICCRYHVDEIAIRYYLSVYEYIKKYSTILLVKLQATRLYNTCYSAIQFSIKISNKKSKTKL